MKPGPYFLVLLLAAASAVLIVVLIWSSYDNQRLVFGLRNKREELQTTQKNLQAIQKELQVKQEELNRGILGQQAQQISGSVLQDMANAAAGNADIRLLLERNGYTLQVPRSTGAPGGDAPGKQPRKEAEGTEASNP